MPSAQPSELTNERFPSRSTAPDAEAKMITRLLFFALIYTVEGFGQIVGLIYQPLNYYLKEAHGWVPLAFARLIKSHGVANRRHDDGDRRRRALGNQNARSRVTSTSTFRSTK